MNVLIHHENRGGKVSGAWEGTGDTLLHVQQQGRGQLRLVFQKARQSSEHHATALQLAWADGEGFTVEEKPELDDDTIAERIIEAIAADPGTGWSRVEDATRGMADKRRMAVRDRLLQTGRIVNVVKDEAGELVALDRCPERRPARLYLAHDPTIRHLPRNPAADERQSAAGRGEGTTSRLPRAARPIEGGRAAAADVHPPRLDLDADAETDTTDAALSLIATAHRNGHLTTAEALDLERLHELIEKARAVREAERAGQEGGEVIPGQIDIFEAITQAEETGR